MPSNNRRTSEQRLSSPTRRAKASRGSASDGVAKKSGVRRTKTGDSQSLESGHSAAQRDRLIELAAAVGAELRFMRDSGETEVVNSDFFASAFRDLVVALSLEELTELVAAISQFCRDWLSTDECAAADALIAWLIETNFDERSSSPEAERAINQGYFGGREKRRGGR